MIKKLIYSLALLSVFGLLVFNRVNTKAEPVSAAAVDYYLKIDGIDGESQAAGREGGEIEILSWSWGESQAGMLLPAVQGIRTGAGAGKVSFADFSFQASMSKASPKLMEAVATGKHIPNAILIGLRPGGDGGSRQFMEIKLHDVLITSYQTGGSSSDMPMESFSLNFAKIEYKHMTQDDTGNEGETVEFGWDVKANKAI